MFYEYSYILEEALNPGVLLGLVSGAPSFLLSVAAYVLSALGLYTIASRREIRHPWLAWIPVLNVWLIGSLSDQYRYVVKGKVCNKRKALLTLNLINLALGIAVLVIGILMGVTVFRSNMGILRYNSVMQGVVGYAIALGCVGVLMLGTGVAAAVIRYVALYDIYMSVDPGNGVVYLVLSILFSVTESFFLFFNRKNDKGMPPRKDTQFDFSQDADWM